MKYKFRTPVRVKYTGGTNIITPDGSQTQAEFFVGSIGRVIRHDAEKGGYLIVIHCPEIKAAFGETITAYFREYELEELSEAEAAPVFPAGQRLVAEAALPGPFEYPVA